MKTESSKINTPKWTFVHVSDMHIGSPRSFRFQPAWNENWATASRQIKALDPDLVLIGGDMTRDGSTHRFELENARDEFDSLDIPWYAIPGNHEVGNKFRKADPMSIQQEFVDRYASVFGNSHWTFEHRGVRFSGFDAFLLGSGLPQEREVVTWLESQRNLPKAQFHIWVIHPALFADHPEEADFDVETDRVAWYFALDRKHRFFLHRLFQDTGATHVISGHIHCRRYFRWEDIDYYFAPSTAFPQWGERWPDGDPTLGFLKFDVFPDRIEPTFQPLSKTSNAIGYGPGGNPPREGRDYSVAWDRSTI